MDAAHLGFDKFLVEHTKLSAQSYRSYKKDFAEFIEYLDYKNCTLSQVTADVLQGYFDVLYAKQLGTATAVRKFSVLKLLCTYLHTHHNAPDLSFVVSTDKRLPFLFSPGAVQALLQKNLQEYEQLGYKELRNFILLYLLFHTSLSINTLVALKKSNLCFKTRTLHYACPKKGTKTIDLSPAFFTVLEVYLHKRPFACDYLFALQSGNTIKPLARQAALVLVKKMVEKPKKTPLPESFTQVLDDDIKELYKKHPRP